MKRDATEVQTQSSAPAPTGAPPPAPHVATTAHGLAAEIAAYGEDLERRYLATRDEWLKAMHAANSGRSADLAKLAIAQEAYEATATEREHWIDSGRVAIPIREDIERHDVEIAVDQGLAWRKVLAKPPTPGILGRIRRRLGGR